MVVGIDYQLPTTESLAEAESSAWIWEQSMGARNRVGTVGVGGSVEGDDLVTYL